MEGVTVEKISPVHIDERGTITDILNKEVSHVGFIVTKKGVVRAKHYHKQSIQYSYILKGKFEVTVANPDNLEERETFILNAGEMITINSNIVHVFKALEDSDMIDMISLSRAGTGYEDDVVRVNI